MILCFQIKESCKGKYPILGKPGLRACSFNWCREKHSSQLRRDFAHQGFKRAFYSWWTLFLRQQPVSPMSRTPAQGRHKKLLVAVTTVLLQGRRLQLWSYRESNFMTYDWNPLIIPVTIYPKYQCIQWNWLDAPLSMSHGVLKSRTIGRNEHGPPPTTMRNTESIVQWASRNSSSTKTWRH